MKYMIPQVCWSMAMIRRQSWENPVKQMKRECAFRQAMRLMTHSPRSTRLRRASLQPYLWKHRLHTLIIILIISLGINLEGVLDNTKDEQIVLPKCCKSFLKFPSPSATWESEVRKSFRLVLKKTTLLLICPASQQGTIKLHSRSVKKPAGPGRGRSAYIQPCHCSVQNCYKL